MLLSVQSLLEQLGQTSPAMLRLIQENQADFMALLNGSEPPPAQPPPAAQEEAGVVTVELTAAEAEAIGRLEQLGFGRDAALQAFLACERDENLAANFLFDGD